MELEKSIEQFKSETGKNAYSDDFDEWSQEFVEWLASRPTCGVEQRKFLDEIELYGKYEGDLCYKDGYLYGDSFPDNIDLLKVIKGE